MNKIGFDKSIIIILINIYYILKSKKKKKKNIKIIKYWLSRYLL